MLGRGVNCVVKKEVSWEEGVSQRVRIKRGKGIPGRGVSKG